MKFIIRQLPIILFLLFGCSSEDEITSPIPPKVDLVEEAKLIPWNILDGKIAYVKNGAVLLIDAAQNTIKILRENGFSWLGWNNAQQIITGCLTGQLGTTIYGIDLNGNEVFRQHGSISVNYCWSKNGRLAYQSGLYLVIDGIVFASLLPTTEEYYSRPAWSVDGQFLIVPIVEHYVYDNYTKLYKYNVSDSTLSDFLVINYNANEFRNFISYPIYSPDGNKLVYVVDRISYSPYAKESSLYTVNSDGTGAQLLTSGFSDRYPGWSPDSKKIIFTRFEVDDLNFDPIGIFVLDLNSNEIVQILPRGGYSTIWFD